MTDPTALTAWLSLLRGHLVPLRGEQAKRYRVGVKDLFNLDVELDSFHVDRMGFSPEVALRHGENCLAWGPSNRFALIVSPRQQHARVLSPQFSFEERLLAQLYSCNELLIKRLTPRELLFGEIENNVDFLHDPSDLLTLDKATIALDSPNGLVEAIDRLTILSDGLGEGDHLLKEEYVDEMLSLVARTRDVYAPGLKSTSVTVCASSFASELFGGVYVLRPEGAAGQRTVLVCDEEVPVASSCTLTVLGKHDPELMDVLYDQGLVTFPGDQQFLQRRLKEIEDDLLVSRSVSVIPLDLVARKRTFLALEDELPAWYWELRDVLKAAASAEVPADEIAEGCEPATKTKLAVPRREPEAVGHLLSELDPSDYLRLFKFNAPKVYREFPTYPRPKQELLAARITLEWGGLLK